LIILTAEANAQELTLFQSAGFAWIRCVELAAGKYAAGPDAGDFVVRAALNSCPTEKAAAVEILKRSQKGAEFEAAVITQMDRTATGQAEMAVAATRSTAR